MLLYYFINVPYYAFVPQNGYIYIKRLIVQLGGLFKTVGLLE